MADIRTCADAELLAILGTVNGLRAEIDMPCDSPRAEFAVTLQLENARGARIGEVTVDLCGTCTQRYIAGYAAHVVKATAIRLQT